jgi:hypothetical protein
MNRGSQDFEKHSFNFLSKKWSKSIGNDSIDHNPKAEWHTMDLKELKTFKTYAEPFSWQVTPGYFL